MKILNRCKNNPKKMWDVICRKYGAEEDEDLNVLLDSLNHYNLKEKRKGHEDLPNWNK